MSNFSFNNKERKIGSGLSICYLRSKYNWCRKDMCNKEVRHDLLRISLDKRHEGV